jgi:hypothetical protein
MLIISRSLLDFQHGYSSALAKEATPVFAALFGPVHRGIGALDQLLGSCGVVGIERNADADPDLTASGVEGKGA